LHIYVITQVQEVVGIEISEEAVQTARINARENSNAALFFFFVPLLLFISTFCLQKFLLYFSFLLLSKHYPRAIASSDFLSQSDVKNATFFAGKAESLLKEVSSLCDCRPLPSPLQPITI
jgi:hypothetical protein